MEMVTRALVLEETAPIPRHHSSSHMSADISVEKSPPWFQCLQSGHLRGNYTNVLTW